MLKRLASSILCIAISLSCLTLAAGCGDSGSGGSSKDKKDGKATITVTVSANELGDSAIFDKYREEHPDVTIEEIPMSNNDSKLISLIASGNPPDIIRCMGYDELGAFVQRGILMPLDEYIEKENINLENLYDIYNMCRFDGENRGQGSLYALPKDWSPTGIWVNKVAFEEVGIPLPSATKAMTWDEFATTAKKLVKWNGSAVERHGCISALKFPTLLEMYLNGYGLSMWSDDFNSTTLESKETRKAIDYFTDLNKTAAMANSLYPASDTTGTAALLENKVGMVLGGYWFTGAYRTNNTIEEAKDKLMFVPAPVGTKEATYCLDLTCIGIFADTEYPDEAFEMWKYLTLSENSVTARAKIGYGLPIDKSYSSVLPKETDFDKSVLSVVEDYQLKTLDLSPKLCSYISYTSLAALFDKYYLPVLYGRDKMENALKTINRETEILVEEGKALVGE